MQTFMAQKNNVYISLRVVFSVSSSTVTPITPHPILVIRGIRVLYWAINRYIVLPGQMTDNTWLCGYMRVVSVGNTDLLFNFRHS